MPAPRTLTAATAPSPSLHQRPPTTGTSGAATLAQAQRGATVEVVGIVDGADPRVARRLFDLGLRAGHQVHVVRRAPLRDPVIYRVAGADLALRRHEAELVRVR